MSTNVAKRVHRIMDIASRMAEKVEGYSASNRIEEIQLHFDGYAEPGYTDPECGIIATGNWNDVTVYSQVHGRQVVSDLPSRISRLFEKLGVEIEWSDEWSECSNCNKLVRTSPNSYGWQQSYKLDDDGLTCHECIEKDPEEHLQSLEGCDTSCNTISSINPSEHGYVKLEECETGWHPGQNDNPREIGKALRAKGITRYLFNLDDVGQFDAKWSVWVKVEEVDNDDSN
jgi:hypothetical protein